MKTQQVVRAYVSPIWGIVFIFLYTDIMSSSEEDNNVEADSSQTKDGLELDDSQDHKVSSCPQLDTNRRSTSRRDQNENSAQAQANGSNSRIPSEPPRKVIISHKSAFQMFMHAHLSPIH